MGYAYPYLIPSTLMTLIDEKLTPTLYTVVSSLPRGARVEKHVLVHSGRFVVPDPESSRQEEHGVEEEELVIDKTPEFSQGDPPPLSFTRSSTVDISIDFE